jgi:hypothetical protein
VLLCTGSGYEPTMQSLSLAVNSLSTARVYALVLELSAAAALVTVLATAKRRPAASLRR